MRAIVVRRFGGVDVLRLEDQADLVPGRGEVLVDVAFSDVGTLDRLIRAGQFREFFDIDVPYIPGGGVGGTVRAVGAGVDERWIGRSVVGGTGTGKGPTGGYAGQAVLAANVLTEVPPGIGVDVATSLLNDGPTSQQLLDVASPAADDRALVLAAAGAAGMLLVQLLQNRGVPVVAAARSAEKTAALRELGINHVVDYGTAEWTAQVETVFPDGPTMVFDGAGAALGRQGFALLADRGRIISYGTSAGTFAEFDADDAQRRGIGITNLLELPAVTAPDRSRLLQRALDACVSHAAIPLLTHVPLADAAKAHTALEQRTAIGKTVLATRSQAGGQRGGAPRAETPVVVRPR
ncbi:zinc-binding dehydrogenase [Winogradskya humida]|uniref:Quinone reductase Qor n=1 Tax=Winogradskya humida TaxID=113566 RepID=A0ABQ3ZLB3_9ACTN|nr:zinc-binding dehydrogenase [Actinoplanes humidus]GIE19289.1 putative quinone reductase Qor [Actinoplanes humidus]